MWKKKSSQNCLAILQNFVTLQLLLNNIYDQTSQLDYMQFILFNYGFIKLVFAG